MIQKEGVSVKLGLNVTEFERGLENSKKTVEGWSGRINKIISTVTFGAISGGLGFAAIGGFFNGLIDKAKSLAAISKTVGLSAESTQGFMRMVKSAVDSEGAANGLGKLNVKVGEARAGVVEASRVFSDLGIGLFNTKGEARGMESVLRDVLDRFRDVQDPAERARMAVKLFGESGAAMASALAKGSSELDRMANKMGNLTSGQIAAINQAKRSMSGMGDWAMSALAYGVVGAKVAWADYRGGLLGASKAVGEFGAESAAVAAARAYEAPGKKLGLSPEETKALAEQDRKIAAREAKAQSAARRILELDEKIQGIKYDIADFEDGTFEHQKAMLDLKDAELDRDEQAKLMREAREKQDDAATARQKTMNILVEQEANLRAAAGAAKGDLGKGVADRSAFTLPEIAAGVLSRNVPAQINRDIILARRVQFDEAFAKRMRGIGRPDLAAAATREALFLRPQISTLNSGEQSPLGALVDRADKTLKELHAINFKLESLSPTQDPG